MSYFDDASLAFLPSGAAGKDGKAYSIKPTDGTGDFTFSRGSNLAATRVGPGPNYYIEKGRENLLLRSNSFDTTWTKSNSSVTSGQSGYDGTNDAWLLENISGSAAYIKQDKVVDGVQTASVYAKSGNVDYLYLRLGGSSSRGLFVNLSNGTTHSTFGTLIDYNVDSVGNDWYRIIVTYEGNHSNFRIYPSASGNTGTSLGDNILIQDAQLEIGLAATEVIESGATTGKAGILEDEPRFDYSGGATCPSLLLEGSRTNAFVNSEYFAAWNSSNASLTTNSITSPQGVVNASSLTDDAVNSRHRINVSDSFTSGTSYTVSVFVKKNSSNRFLLINASTAFNARAALNLDTLEITNINGTEGKIEDYGNGWYRFSVSGQATNTTSQNIYMQMQNSAADVSYVGDGSSFYLWGAVLEEGNFSTSYIPTYGVSQTRAQDICGGAGDAATFNDSEGVLYAEIEALANDGLTRTISINDNSGNNVVRIGYTATSNEVNFIIRATTNIYVYNQALSDTTTINKIAISYNSSGAKVFINGVLSDSGALSSLPTGLSQLDFRYGNGNFNFYGKTKQVLVFPTALSDSDLATLTTL